MKNLFNRFPITDVFAKRKEDFLSRLSKASGDYFMNSTEAYIDNELFMGKVDLIEVVWDDIKSSINMERIAATGSWHSITGMRDRAYVTYAIRHKSGRFENIFYYSLNNYSAKIIPGDFDNLYIYFNVYTDHANENLPDNIIDDVKKQKLEIIGDLKQIVTGLNERIPILNSEFEVFVRKSVEEKKKSIIAKQELLGRL
jgi:hypothetical protein